MAERRSVGSIISPFGEFGTGFYLPPSALGLGIVGSALARGSGLLVPPTWTLYGGLVKSGLERWGNEGMKGFAGGMHATVGGFHKSYGLTGATIGKREFRKAYSSVIKSAMRSKTTVSNLDVLGLITKGGAGATQEGMVSATKNISKITKSMNVGMQWMKVGSVASSIGWGIFIGQATVGAATLAFKGAAAASNYIETTAEHIRSLEFGGNLGAGYRTGAAATERQRALQEIQRSHFSGRASLGNEGRIMHDLV